MFASRATKGWDRRLWTSDVRATLSLALPLIAMNLSQVAINATDVIMMGWLGPEALPRARSARTSISP